MNKVEARFLVLAGIFFLGHDLVCFMLNLPFAETFLDQFHKCSLALFPEHATFMTLVVWAGPLLLGLMGMVSAKFARSNGRPGTRRRVGA